jgi:S1-C subfamily serine protease
MTRKFVLIPFLFLFFTLTVSTAFPQRYQEITDFVRLNDMSTSLKGLAHRVSPAIVQVNTKGFYPIQGEGESLVGTQIGTGSGVILDSDGFIVTNAHVVEGARKIEVVLALGMEDDRQKRIAVSQAGGFLSIGTGRIGAGMRQPVRSAEHA